MHESQMNQTPLFAKSIQSLNSDQRNDSRRAATPRPRASSSFRPAHQLLFSVCRSLDLGALLLAHRGSKRTARESCSLVR